MGNLAAKFVPGGPSIYPWFTTSPASAAWWFDRILLESLPHQLPGLQPTLPNNTIQLPLETYQRTKPSRTPSSAGQPPSPGVSTTVFTDGHHMKLQQPCGHSAGQGNHKTWPTRALCPLPPQGFDWSSVELGSLRCIRQEFPVIPRYMFGFIRSFQHLSPLWSNSTAGDQFSSSSSKCLKYTTTD